MTTNKRRSGIPMLDAYEKGLGLGAEEREKLEQAVYEALSWAYSHEGDQAYAAAELLDDGSIRGGRMTWQGGTIVTFDSVEKLLGPDWAEGLDMPSGHRVDETDAVAARLHEGAAQWVEKYGAYMLGQAQWVIDDEPKKRGKERRGAKYGKVVDQWD